MTLGFTQKCSSSHPRPISWIVVSIGVVTVLLTFASLIIVSYPIGSSLHRYFYSVESSETSTELPLNASLNLEDSKKPLDLQPSRVSSDVSSDSKVGKSNSQELVPVTKELNGLETSDAVVSSSQEQVTPFDNSSLPAHSNSQFDLTSPSPSPSPIPVDGTNSSIVKGCDLYHGNWVYDPSGPLYTNNSCPVLTQMQNCQGNGRPDKDYENWRWKPFQCDLPRFDPMKFLELMRGKTLAFIGDSVARNQMESMLCILWQVEEPKNQGTRNMQQYYFESTSVTIIRIWSSWLVKHNSEQFDFAPVGVEKLYLESPDEIFMEFIPTFDVIVLSSGHWFVKQSVYILNNEIVGGQLWWPDKTRHMKINSVEAFGISVDTILTALVTHPNYTGLTILRSYSPDHYEGGGWNTGGSCTGKVKPLATGELVENRHLNAMHEKQVTGFNRAIKKAKNRSKMRLMDITEVFQYRHDGHPGPFRNADLNKITKRGRDGRPPPQDCLHWCMPGPVDTWNEIVFEIIKREYEDDITS